MSKRRGHSSTANLCSPSEGDITITIDPSNGHLGVTLRAYAREGVRIEDCDPKDLVARAGLAAGDVITSVNGKSVSGHAETLHLICSLTTPFTIGARPCPELLPIRGWMASAARAGRAAALCAAPSLILVGSTEFLTKCASVVILALAMATALAKPTAAYRGRLLSCVLLFACLFALVSAGQEVRRCVTTLCDYPTMYGSAADCRAPCHTHYGRYWHWPAVAVSVLATSAAGRAAVKFVGVVEAIEGLPPYIKWPHS